MVQSVSGRYLPAVLPGSAAARNLAQQNLVLPSPLSSPEQQAQQRASAILRFNAPTLSSATLASLQDSALRAQVAPPVTREGEASQPRVDQSRADDASRAAQAYANAAQSLQPLIALGTPPPNVLNLQVLAPGAADSEADERKAERSGSDDRRQNRKDRETVTRDPARENPLLPEPRQNFPALGPAAGPVASPVAAPASASSLLPAAGSRGGEPARSLGANLGLRVDLGA